MNPNLFLTLTVSLNKKVRFSSEGSGDLEGKVGYSWDFGDGVASTEMCMAAYESELREPPHPRSIAMLEVRAAFWGQQSGYRWAEAFDVVRERW